MNLLKKSQASVPFRSTKMVKTTKKETPRKRNSLSKSRKIVKVVAQVSEPAITPSTNIRVVVRVRPPNSKEQDANSRTVVKVIDDQMLIFDPKEDSKAFFFHGVQQKGRDLSKKSHKDMKFLFDRVFSTDCSTTEVFQGSTHALIDSLMDGYNCSVFAYGATGAGKTFTMSGSSTSPGITYLTMTELFRKHEELEVEREFEVGVTYLEVYNELVRDLLNPGPPLDLREDPKYGVTVAGIKVHRIKDPKELFALLDEGNKHRTQHPTDANAESSRSHAVFQVYLQMTMKSTREIRTAKLSMIDLAGSERGSATGYVGARFTEGANINRSLLALGNCINSLADGLKHVPYRNSKLTRLLKDSLGGNCQTVMIANVSPSSLSFEDTYNTLKYATRAKKIKFSVKQNLINVDLHVGQYVKMLEDAKKEIVMLKRQLEEEKCKNRDNSDDIQTDELKKTLQSLREQLECLHEENMKLSDNKQLLDENVRLSSELENIYEVGGRNGIIDDDVVNEVNSLIGEKKVWLERELQLEKSGKGTAIRRILKEAIDNRLSDLMTDTPEKQAAHNKIAMTVDRLKKKEKAVSADLELVQQTKSDIDKKLDVIMEKHPSMRNWIICQKLNLQNLEQQFQNEILLKQMDIVNDDQQSKDALMEEMAVVLKKLYMQLKGHGLLAPSLNKQYQDIVHTYQGKKNIKWAEIPDSGISSTSSITSVEEPKPMRKRIADRPATPNSKLDGTFTRSSPPKASKQKPRVNTTNPGITKVTKPVKRLAKKFSPNKENRPFRKPMDTLRTATTTKAILAIKNYHSIKGNAKAKTPERPRFQF